MGGWKLEAFKMGIYMFFPVSLFYYFNQAEYYEDWMIKTKRELYPHESRMKREEIEKTIVKLQERRENETLELLESHERNWESTVPFMLHTLRHVYICRRYIKFSSLFLKLEWTKSGLGK